MSNILHVELSDTFNKQRQTINQIIDYTNGNPKPVAGNGISTTSTNTISVRTSGDALSFDSSGNLVGNDAYPNLLTQVVLDPNGPSTVPTTITSTTIVFPQFDVIFGNKVYYGKKISDFETVHVPQTTMTVAPGVDGAVFVYVNTNGEIQQSLTSVTPANSSVQCLLGSYFRLNNQIQENSWKYTPWNGSTSKDSRFMNNGAISGGLMTANTASTLSRDAVNVVYEGVNVEETLYLPNQITYEEESTYITKKLWPGYDASVLDTSDIDTTHIYNMTSEQVDDISGIDGYIILIPGIVAPTGQDVYLMAMSDYINSSYNQIYLTMEDAESAIYGLDLSFGNVASRVAWFGQSIIVKIGATDFRDKNQFRVVGSVPNIIRSYSSLSGAGQGSRVEGLTIKADGSVIGLQSSKNTIDFEGGFAVLNTSENEVSVSVIDELTPKLSNCVLKNPQNILLELSGGALTLKSGSKVYYPDGFEQNGTTKKFSTYTLSSDISQNIVSESDGKYLLLGIDDGNGNLLYSSIDHIYTQATEPSTPEEHSVWYDTTSNTIKLRVSNAWVDNFNSKKLCFPLCIFNIENNATTKIDYIFNGFGYIGNILYVYPGLEVLIPNGFNTDGTLKSIAYTTEAVSTISIISSGGFYLTVDHQGTLNLYSTTDYQYNNSVNYNLRSSGLVSITTPIVSLTSSGGIISVWNSKTAFHIPDYYEIDNIVGIQGKLLQQVFSTNWPSTTDPNSWPHNIIIYTANDFTLSTVLPAYNINDPKILTWEVVIQNTSNNSIDINWPSVYQPFNGENLISTIAANTTIFMMFRRYTGNYVLVSHQGTQVNSQI